MPEPPLGWGAGMTRHRTLFGAALLVVALAAHVSAAERAVSQSRAAVAGCIPVSTPEDLNRVHYNLAGRFCLTNDIDFAGADFAPIGTSARPFLGDLDGRGF